MIKRILIDGRFVGVGESQTRYVLELTRNLLQIDKGDEYTLLIRACGISSLPQYFNIGNLEIEELSRNSRLEIKNFHIVVLDIPHYSFAEQTKLLKFLNKEKFDLVHFAQFNHPIGYKGNFVVTIQDLTLLNFPVGNPLKRLAFFQVMKSAATKSKKIIAISEETARQTIYTFRLQKEKIAVIYHGVDHDKFNLKAKTYKDELEEFKKNNGITEDYLLYVGAWKVHKNLIRLLQAYEKYLLENEKFIHLVLLGGQDKKERKVWEEIERINKLISDKFGKKAIITAAPVPVQSNILPAVYAGATAYVIPSLAEGFGWPPLEAMACGTPVISANVSSMPEILGDAASYFDPLSIDEMAIAIKKIISDRDLRAQLIKKGLLQVQKYNWDDTAAQTLKIYREVLGQ